MSATRKIVLWTFILWVLISSVGVFLLWHQKQQGKTVAAPAKETLAALPPTMLTLPDANPIVMRQPNFTNPDSLWVIVSKLHPIPTDYVPKKLVLPSVLTRADKSQAEQSVRKEVVAPLKEMFDAAEKAGLPLIMASGYRSAETQKGYFDENVRQKGLAYAQAYSALPGISEHQTGLAIDISTSDQGCVLDESCYINGPESKWLAENAHTYGFILRYPENKEAITGINYEPWHYRYVGKELATALYESGLTLDEALPYLQKAQAEHEAKTAKKAAR